MLGMLPASAQESGIAVPELVSDNIDSLIADSVKKAFILNHRPVVAAELNRVELGQVKGFYGNYVSKYMANLGFYKVNAIALRQYISKRNPPALEWVFYGFALLFLFLSLINAYFSSYLQKVFRVFANEGFIYRQAKDQMIQAPVAAFFMNLLFVLSGTAYVYFGLGGNGYFIGMDRWQSMGLILFFFIAVYAFKYVFLEFMGWLLNLKEPFENYVFIVFLNTKISGILMLFASFFMAFSEPESSQLIFRSSLYLLAIVILIRFFRGFQVFSKQARLGFFNFLLAVISLEILPSAVMLKFISSSVELLSEGLF
jgi:hypothetical protein